MSTIRNPAKTAEQIRVLQPHELGLVAGAASNVQKKLDDTGNAVIGKI